MSIDPKLQALFAQAKQSFDRDAFVRRVMARIDRDRRQAMLLWAGFSIVFVVALALLAPLLIAAAGMATQLLPVSLVDVETGWLRQLIAPINSVAAAIAIGALAIRWFFRRILG